MTDLYAVPMLEDEFRYLYQCLLREAEINKALIKENNELKQELKRMKGEGPNAMH